MGDGGTLMTIDHDEVRVSRSKESETPVRDINLLIKEASSRQRMRYLLVAVSLIIVLLSIVGISAIRGGSNAPDTSSGVPKKGQPFTVLSLPTRSRVWTLDMRSSSSGYAVAGISSLRKKELLIKTTDQGQSWSVVARLPYSFEAGQFKPLLDFVTPSIGYTQTFREGSKWVPNKIYVTTDAGKKWSKLHIAGQVPSAMDVNANSSSSPDFRASKGVLSLLSLDCTLATSNGPCPATLSEYRWGSTKPFTSHRVAFVGPGPKVSTGDTYMVEAPTVSTALVAEGVTTGGPYRFALTTNAGASWSQVSNPCQQYPNQAEVTFNGVALSPNRWILNCSQGTGMNHANVRLSETTNDGRTWATINYTPAWSAKPGAIAGEMDQVWTSNGGNVFWSYSTVGFIQVSTDGGRTWAPIEVNGKPSNIDTGGWPIEFDPVGPSGAYFVTKSGQVLLSRNGSNFVPLKLLRGR